MKKRVLAALLVTMMTVGTVAGCGSNAKSDDSDKKASCPLAIAIAVKYQFVIFISIYSLNFIKRFAADNFNT